MIVPISIIIQNSAGTLPGLPSKHEVYLVGWQNGINAGPAVEPTTQEPAKIILPWRNTTDNPTLHLISGVLTPVSFMTDELQANGAVTAEFAMAGATPGPIAGLFQLFLKPCTEG